MPDPDILTALTMLEHCRFAYKAYAQTCVHPMDPFYESHGKGVWQGARDRVMEEILKRLGTSEMVAKFDPVQYKLDETPHPRRGVVYRGGTGDEPYILFQPRPLDQAIAFAKGVDVGGEDIAPADLDNGGGTKRCCHFQGMTGMTHTHPGSGWRSWMGSVIYDSRDQSIVVVFRGSRSGAGGRALAQALTQSKGSPDWVTDMNHLKGMDVARFQNATFVAGFWLAYASCKRSLEAAFYEALWNQPLKSIYFTGHSLGGALAQCAYLDFVAGDLLSKSVSLQALKKKVPTSCYAISAPPIIVGSASREKVLACVGQADVYHYFVKKDAVHDSGQVGLTGASAMNAVVATVTHPLTSVCHIGTELRLESSAGFPDAHEPEEVRKAMLEAISSSKKMGLGPDPGFWPLVKLDITRPREPRLADSWGAGAELLRTALSFSTSHALAQALAELWAAVRKGSSSSKGSYASLEDADGAAFGILEEVRAALVYLGNPFIADRAQKTAELMKLREGLVEIFAGASGHKATSAAVFAMLQYVAATHFSYGGLH